MSIHECLQSLLTGKRVTVSIPVSYNSSTKLLLYLNSCCHAYSIMFPKS